MTNKISKFKMPIEEQYGYLGTYFGYDFQIKKWREPAHIFVDNKLIYIKTGVESGSTKIFNYTTVISDLDTGNTEEFTTTKNLENFMNPQPPEGYEYEIFSFIVEDSSTVVTDSGDVYAYVSYRMTYIYEDESGDAIHDNEVINIRLEVDFNNKFYGSLEEVLITSDNYLFQHYEISQYRTATTYRNGTFYTAEYGNENRDFIIYSSSTGLNFTEYMSLDSSYLKNLGTANYKIEGVYSYKDELYVWFDGDTESDYYIPGLFYLDESNGTIELASKMLGADSNEQSACDYHVAFGRDEIIVSRWGRGDGYYDFRANNIDNNQWDLENKKALLFSPLRTPFIEGDLNFNNHTLEERDLRGYYTHAYDSDIYSDNFVHNKIDFIDNHYKIFLINQESFNSGNDKIIIGFYGAKPIQYTGYNASLGYQVTVDRNLDRVSTEIYTEEDLFNIRYLPYENFKLMNDIDLANFQLPSYHPDVLGYSEGEYAFEQVSNANPSYFPPINNYYADNNDIELSFDGKDYTISNLTWISPDENNASLIGGYMSTTYNDDNSLFFKNINLENINLEGSWFSGGIVSELKEGSIKNCHVTGDITTGDEAGGIAGSAYVYDGMSIEKCSFVGNITSKNGYGCGGIVGYGDVVIKNCYAKGIIEDHNAVAGIIAGLTESGYIKNSYFAGELKGTNQTAPIAIDDGYRSSSENLIEGCYYDSEKIGVENFTSNSDGELPRTTAEMTHPYDETTTYIGWDFEDVWGIHEDQNDGYPNFNRVVSLIANFIASTVFNSSIMRNLAVMFESETSWISEIQRWFPIVRTNSAKRDGPTLHLSGTLLSAGPYIEELWDRKISGFFQYASETFDFDSFNTDDTIPKTLPIISTTVTSSELVNDINSTQTEIELTAMPSEFEITTEISYKYLMITDEGNKTEIIGYTKTDGNFLKQVDRGILNSSAYDFTAGDMVYKSDMEGSLTFEDDVGPIAKRTEYKYRAAIEVNTELSTTGESKTFTFYGGEMTSPIDESEDFEGLNRGELFLDARDLEFEDQLLDRAKLTFEEMEFEGWNTEEFKNWVWDEFSGVTERYFENMTLAELIKIAAGITDYTEQDLVNNYDREEIEEIISDKLDVVTADEIDAWAFDVAKLVARLLTGEPAGAYDDWTESEVKEFLKIMLTNEISYADFEDKFPFDKWETLMKAKLNISINNNASIEVEYNQYGPYDYMIDFQLGDIVIVEYPEVFRAMVRIIEVKEEHTPEGKKYTLTLGKEFETLIGNLKSDRDSISGRL